MVLARTQSLGQHLLADLAGRTGVALAANGSIRPQAWPIGIAIENVTIAVGDTPLSRLDRLELSLSPAALLHGRLRVGGARFTGWHLGENDIDSGAVTLAAQSVVVDLRWRDRPWTVTLSRDGDGIDASVRQGDHGLSARFVGRRDGGGVDGTVDVAIADLASQVPDLPLPPAIAVTARGQVHLGDGQVTLTDMAVQAGASRATGRLSLLTGHPTLVEASLAVDTIDIGPWLAPAAAGATTATESVANTTTATESAANTTTTTEPVAGPSPAATPATPKALGRDLFASLDLTVGTLTWGTERMGALRAEAGWEQGALIVRHAALILGDGGRLSGDGEWSQGRTDARLRIDGPRWRGQARVSAAASRLEITELSASGGGHHADGRLTIVPAGNTILVPDLNLAVDGWPLRGDGRIGWRDGRPQIAATLRLGMGEAAATASDAGTRRPQDGPVQPKPPPPRPAPAAPPTRGAPAGPSWLDQPLDLTALTAMDADLNVSAPMIMLGRVSLDHPGLRLRSAADGIHISDFHARLGDGTASGAASLTAGPQPMLRLQARLAGIDLARWAGQPAIAGITVESLPADLDTRLSAQGATPRALVATLAGPITLHGNDGRLGGADMAALNRHLGHVGDFGNVLALLRTALGGGTTRLVATDATCAIANSTLTCPRLTVRAEGAALTGDGMLVVDRDARPATLRATLAVAMEALPDAPLRLKLDGPVDQPAITVDANALQRALVRSGLGQALKGDGVDGDGGKVAPRDVLKGLLRAFGGRQ